MKGLEKLTSIRLAEVLSQKSVVATDAITDALYTQDQFGEPFCEVLVETDNITEWDLAKVVVEHFQLPFITAGNYDVVDEARDKVAESLLFRNLLVPLDVFGAGIAVAMPVLTPFEVLERVQGECRCEVFPFVGLISENKRVLQDLFPNFNDWHAKDQEMRERRRQSTSRSSGSDWMNIFDSADKAVRTSLNG